MSTTQTRSSTCCLPLFGRRAETPVTKYCVPVVTDSGSSNQPKQIPVPRRRETPISKLMYLGTLEEGPVFQSEGLPVPEESLILRKTNENVQHLNQDEPQKSKFCLNVLPVIPNKKERDQDAVMNSEPK